MRMYRETTDTCAQNSKNSERNMPFLKGALFMPKNVRLVAVQKTAFYCKHTGIPTYAQGNYGNGSCDGFAPHFPCGVYK